MSTSPATLLSVSSVQGLSLGQVSLINYVEHLGLLNRAPFLRSPYDAIGLPTRFVDEVRRGERPAWDAPLYGAASLVLQSRNQKRALLEKLGLPSDAVNLAGASWVSEVPFFASVDDELSRMRRAVDDASREVKAWMKAMRKFNDSGEYFDVTQEPKLNTALTQLQDFFSGSIRQAREIERDYGLRSFAGVEVYFALSRHR
jgi:hypothetical protein